jgi:DNA-binding NtrC family response regulator
MTHTILVVEDNPPSVPGLVDALTTAGLTAVTASGFTDALEVLAGLEPEVLVTGVRLGPYNGLHLVVRARSLYPGTAAILIGQADPTVARDARALGAAAYLTTGSADAIVSEALRILGGADAIVDVPALSAGPAAPPLLDVPA